MTDERGETVCQASITNPEWNHRWCWPGVRRQYVRRLSLISMNKQHILTEIARTAAANGGTALGRERFYRETGIKESDWSGKHWARWGDAVKEAGCTPNQMQVPIEEGALLEALAVLVRELGHWPVVAELKLKAKQTQGFPSHNTFSRIGNRAQQRDRLTAYCQEHSNLTVLALLPAAAAEVVAATSDQEAPAEAIGFVYLLKATKYFKVGRSSSFERRSRELAIQLPEKAKTVHVIRTDDPVGIELYWHRRFESKRKNGEWFELNAQDVKAFKRRKFM